MINSSENLYNSTERHIVSELEVPIPPINSNSKKFQLDLPTNFVDDLSIDNNIDKGDNHASLNSKKFLTDYINFNVEIGEETYRKILMTSLENTARGDMSNRFVNNCNETDEICPGTITSRNGDFLGQNLDSVTSRKNHTETITSRDTSNLKNHKDGEISDKSTQSNKEYNEDLLYSSGVEQNKNTSNSGRLTDREQLATTGILQIVNEVDGETIKIREELSLRQEDYEYQVSEFLQSPKSNPEELPESKSINSYSNLQKKLEEEWGAGWENDILKELEEIEIGDLNEEDVDELVDVVTQTEKDLKIDCSGDMNLMKSSIFRTRKLCHRKHEGKIKINNSFQNQNSSGLDTTTDTDQNVNLSEAQNVFIRRTSSKDTFGFRGENTSNEIYDNVIVEDFEGECNITSRKRQSNRSKC